MRSSALSPAGLVFPSISGTVPTPASMRHPENIDRWVRAYWDDEARESYKATLDIVCMDRPNLVSGCGAGAGRYARAYLLADGARRQSGDVPG